MAPYISVLIQYTRGANSLKYVGPVFHFDTTIRPVLGGQPVVHGQVSTDDRMAVPKRLKCTRQSTVHEKLSVMSIHEIFHCSPETAVSVYCLWTKSGDVSIGLSLLWDLPMNSYWVGLGFEQNESGDGDRVWSPTLILPVKRNWARFIWFGI